MLLAVVSVIINNKWIRMVITVLFIDIMSVCNYSDFSSIYLLKILSSKLN
jgi:hypothetical protein